MKENIQIYLVFLCCVLGLVLSTPVQAQQEPQYTQYMYNTQVINPAYAGSRGSLSVLGLYRTQWVGLDGAPQTANFSLNSPVGLQGIGLGLGVLHDEIGPQTASQVTADISYTIQLNDNDLKLAFGIKAGMNMMDINGEKLNWYNPNDPTYNFIVRHKTKPVIGAGFFLYDENWYVGLSSPNFLSTEYYDDTKVSVYNAHTHFYLSGGYVFQVSENLKLKPSVILKTIIGAPMSADVSLNAMFSEIFTLGAGYRFESNASFSALAGVQITNQLLIGYAYDLQTGALQHYNSGSHEIFLRFELGTRLQPKVNPRFF